MKVVHFYKTYYPDTFGGVEQVIYQLAEGCKILGIDTEVLSISSRGKTRNGILDSHKVHTSKLSLNFSSTNFSFSAFKDFEEVTRNADIVHYHFPYPFMDLVHFAKRPKCRTVVTYHSDIVRQKKLLGLYKPLMNKFLDSIDAIVATSPDYLESSPVLSARSAKVKVIPIGIDRTKYLDPTEQTVQLCRRRFGEKFFLFIGVLRYYKGIQFLLKAMQNLDYPLVIAGGGEVEKDLKKQAVELGLKNCTFLGRVTDEDKCTLLKSCYCFVFPSHLRSEAFGVSLLEAAMFCKPLISCNIGTGTSYINQNEITGLIVAPENPEALEQAMQRLWCQEEKARLFGAAALQRYQELFTGKRMVYNYSQLYGSLSERGRKLS